MVAVAGVVGTFLTGVYTFRMLFLVFWGEPSAYAREHHHTHEGKEGPPEMFWPLCSMGWPSTSHPSAPPRFTLPLVRRPVGPVRRVLSSLVSDFAYAAQRVVVPRGSTFRWRFSGPSQHDVTLASGPVGFSSASVFNGEFTFRFTKPGVYQLFCSLHPTEMTQVVTVR